MVPSRKALRKELRREKSERKAKNYMRIKKETKMRTKARYASARHSERRTQGLTSNATPELSRRAPKRMEPSGTTSLECRAKFIPLQGLEMEDPLLTFADKALEEGILRSDGEFDEDAMNSLFVASGAESSSASAESDSNVESECDAITQEPRLTQPPLRSPLQDAGCSSGSKLQRLTQGHLNRLALGNFESIALSMAREAEAHGRNQFTGTFAATLRGALVTDANLLDSYILNYAALTAALVYYVGTDLVGCVLEELVAELDQRRHSLRGIQASDPHESNSLRVFMNVITALSFLYDLQVISKAAVLEMLSECIEGIEYEHEVEGLVRLIRLCGAQLRREDPVALKRVISLIQERAQHLNLPSQSSRFKFMLDVVQDLKSNKQRLVAIQRGDMEAAKKLLKSLQQARGSSKMDPLNVSLGDIREAKSKGKWWRIGAAWKGREKTEVTQPILENKSENTQLLAIAKEQHMNTEVRRTIFGALMTSEDCHDAFRRLLALRLPSRQEQEIVHVILHCLCKEKVYNPYYALVAAKFIDTRHNVEISFKYALWDRLALLQKGEVRPRSITHLANFYGALIARKLLPLSSLCKVSFTELSSPVSLFLSLVLGTLFEQAKTDIDVITIFEKLNNGPNRKRAISGEAEDVEGERCEGDDQTTDIRRLELANFRNGLKLFLRQQFGVIAKLMNSSCALSRMRGAWKILNE